MSLHTDQREHGRNGDEGGLCTIFDGDFAEEITDIGNLALNSLILLTPLADNTLALVSLKLRLIQRLGRLKHLPRDLKIILLLLPIPLALALLTVILLLVLCIPRKGDCGGRFGGFGVCCRCGSEDLFGIFPKSVVTHLGIRELLT
jgi:hypothetical protein